MRLGAFPLIFSAGDSTGADFVSPHHFFSAGRSYPRLVRHGGPMGMALACSALPSVTSFPDVLFERIT